MMHLPSSGRYKNSTQFDILWSGKNNSMLFSTKNKLER